MKNEEDQLKNLFRQGVEHTAGHVPDFNETMEAVRFRHLRHERKRWWLKAAASVLLVSTAGAFLILNRQKEVALPESSIITWNNPTRSLQSGYSTSLGISQVTTWKSPTGFLLQGANRKLNN